MKAFVGMKRVQGYIVEVKVKCCGAYGGIAWRKLSMKPFEEIAVEENMILKVVAFINGIDLFEVESTVGAALG